MAAENDRTIPADGQKCAINAETVHLCLTGAGAKVTGLLLDRDELVLTIRVNASTLQGHVLPPDETPQSPIDLRQDQWEEPSALESVIVGKETQETVPEEPAAAVEADEQEEHSDLRFGEPQPDVEWAALMTGDTSQQEAPDAQVQDTPASEEVPVLDHEDIADISTEEEEVTPAAGELEPTLEKVPESALESSSSLELEDISEKIQPLEDEIADLEPVSEEPVADLESIEPIALEEESAEPLDLLDTEEDILPDSESHELDVAPIASTENNADLADLAPIELEEDPAEQETGPEELSLEDLPPVEELSESLDDVSLPELEDLTAPEEQEPLTDPLENELPVTAPMTKSTEDSASEDETGLDFHPIFAEEENDLASPQAVEQGHKEKAERKKEKGTPQSLEEMTEEEREAVKVEQQKKATVAINIAADLLNELNDLSSLDDMLGDEESIVAKEAAEAEKKKQDVPESSSTADEDPEVNDDESSLEQVEPLAPSMAAMIRYVCPRCQAAGTVHANRVGDVVTCSSCGRAMRLRLKH